MQIEEWFATIVNNVLFSTTWSFLAKNSMNPTQRGNGEFGSNTPSPPMPSLVSFPNPLALEWGEGPVYAEPRWTWTWTRGNWVKVGRERNQAHPGHSRGALAFLLVSIDCCGVRQVHIPLQWYFRLALQQHQRPLLQDQYDQYMFCLGRSQMKTWKVERWTWEFSRWPKKSTYKQNLHIW